MASVDVSSYADPGVNKLLGTASNDPSQAIASAQGAMNLAGTAQVMKLRDVALGQSQLDLAKSKLGALNQVLGAVVADPSADNFGTQLTEAVKQGVIDPDTAQRTAAQVMTFGGDPAKIKAWATDHLNQNASHQQLMDQAYGTPGMLSNGAASSPIMTRAGAGGGVFPAAGPTVVQQLGPDAATAPQTGPINPDGSPTQTTRAAAVARQGGMPAVVTPFGAIAYPGRAAAASAAPSAAGPGPTPAPSAPAGAIGDSAVMAARQRLAAAQDADPSTMTRAQQQQLTADTGTVAAYQQQQATPQGSPAAPDPAALAASPMTVGLAPGVAEAKSSMGVQGAARLAQLQQEASTGPEQNAALDNLTAQLGKVSTGPLASRINTAKASFNQIAGMAGLPQIDPQGVAAYDEIHKSAAQLAGAAASAFGSGTNDKLALAIAQNPSEALSNMSNQQVVPLIKGMIAAKQVRAEAANAYVQQHGGDPSAVGAFETDWNKNASPRAFQFAFMNPAQRTDLLASMSPAEKKQLAGALDTSESRGWIKSGAGQ